MFVTVNLTRVIRRLLRLGMSGRCVALHDSRLTWSMDVVSLSAGNAPLPTDRTTLSVPSASWVHGQRSWPAGMAPISVDHVPSSTGKASISPDNAVVQGQCLDVPGPRFLHLMRNAFPIEDNASIFVVDALCFPFDAFPGEDDTSISVVNAPCFPGDAFLVEDNTSVFEGDGFAAAGNAFRQGVDIASSLDSKPELCHAADAFHDAEAGRLLRRI